jgi:antitoxin MazE
MRARVQKWGNSLAVRIPRHVTEAANLKEGDSLEIDISASGALHLEKTRKVPSLTELVAQITPENRYEEVSSGREVGRERVEW